MRSSSLSLKVVKLLVLYAALIVLATLVWQLTLTTLTPREQHHTSNISTMNSFGKAGNGGGTTGFLKFYVKSRRDIFPLTTYPNPYHINNKLMCRTDKNVDVLVLVISAAPYFHKRRDIRRTWGNITQYHNHKVRLVFLLGSSRNVAVNTDIMKENTAHNDIVQGNFIDSYHNLTHKAVMGMRWISENCPSAKLVVKTDDDTFVNIFKLLEDVDGKYRNKSKEILCDVFTMGSSPIQRHSKLKWRLSEEYFPNNTCFPFPHCRGFFVIFSPDIIAPLYETAKTAPFLWLDDVYLTGVLPAILGGIKLTPLDNLLTWRESDALKCFQSTKKRCDVRAVIIEHPITVESLWNDTLKNQNIPPNSSRTSFKAILYGTDLICRTIEIRLIYYILHMLNFFALVYISLRIAPQTYSHRRFLQAVKLRCCVYLTNRWLS